MADDTKALIAITALNKMFEGSHFSICTIDKLATMLGVRTTPEVYNQLSALHCVNWNDMPRELRSRVPALIQECLAGDAIPRFELTSPDPHGVTRVIDGSPHTRRPLLERIFPKGNRHG